MKSTTLILAAVAATSGLIHAQEAKPHPKQAFEQLMERAKDAKNAGRTDEASELAAQAEKLRHEMHELRMQKKPEGSPELKKEPKHHKEAPPAHSADKVPMKGPEAERLHHIMQAVEHLNAAGLKEPAHHIAQMAQNMRREMEERMKHEHAQKAATAAPAKHHVPQAELEELRQQLRKMQEHIDLLAAELKKQRG